MEETLPDKGKSNKKREEFALLYGRQQVET
jgi:hypothetical protein